MTGIKLWSWQMSPFAGKARIALAEKGVQYELLEIDPRNRPARLRELNPSGRVPVLELDGVGIPESTVICEWLEERWPEPPFWPGEPDERARARARLRWVDDELTVNFFLAIRKQAFGAEETDHPDVVEILYTRLGKRWATVEQLLTQSGGPWLMPGEEPTLADLAAIPLAVRLPEWRPDLAPSAEEYPGVTAWLARLRERPSAAQVARAGEPVAG